MTTVAIITEYNPFHTGHKYQIDEIRREFGEDTRIIAIMSGNYTQRAEPAIMDKFLRAESAVKGGADLVLELPFPFSMSSAEFFAKSGVYIASSLGCVDFLSFGSESGDIECLRTVAENMSRDEYKDALRSFLTTADSQRIGYPKACENVYNATFTHKIDSSFFTPNNILAIEYLKAIHELGSSLLPHTIKRVGQGYNESEINKNSSHQSASAIREIMRDDLHSALEFLPESSVSTITEAYNKGLLPTDEERISSSLISNLRLNSATESHDIMDAGGGLYNRLRANSFKTKSISNLTKLTDTKKYTQSRVRRALWYSYFGVTSSDVRELPQYTQLLAAGSVGKTILKNIKKAKGIPVITKPSSYDHLDVSAKRQKETSDRADSVYTLTMPGDVFGNIFLKKTPYIDK